LGVGVEARRAWWWVEEVGVEWPPQSLSEVGAGVAWRLQSSLGVVEEEAVGLSWRPWS
jgi:hypothetical protein